MVDKCDIAGIGRTPSLKLLQEVAFAIQNNGGIEPNLYTDVYKNRRGKYNMVRVWSYIDKGTCRVKDLFMTTENNEIIDVDLMRSASNIPEFSYDIFDSLQKKLEKKPQFTL